MLEARAAGASAVLLIVRALAGPAGARCWPARPIWGSMPWSKSILEAELRSALAGGAPIVGVNSRDLDAFTIDTKRPGRSSAQVPAGSHRGGRERHRLPGRRGAAPRRAPMRSWSEPRSPRRRPRRPPARARRGAPACPLRSKICGLMRPGDAMSAIEAGASYLGVVFAGVQGGSPCRRRRDSRRAAGYRSSVSLAISRSTRSCGSSEAAGLSGAPSSTGSIRRADAARLQGSGLLVWRVVRLAGAGRSRCARRCDARRRRRAGRAASVPCAWRYGRPARSGLALEVERRLAGHTMVLAGGLTPATVARRGGTRSPRDRRCKSGVERLPGIKDPEKIARFHGGGVCP